MCACVHVCMCERVWACVCEGISLLEIRSLDPEKILFTTSSEKHKRLKCMKRNNSETKKASNCQSLKRKKKKTQLLLFFLFFSILWKDFCNLGILLNCTSVTFFPVSSFSSFAFVSLMSSANLEELLLQIAKNVDESAVFVPQMVEWYTLDTRDHWFETKHRQKIAMYLNLSNCNIKKTKKWKRGHDMSA